jgi:hypothetical protein
MSIPGLSQMGMALEIDTLLCSVGVAALRDASCGAGRPVKVVWVCHCG